MIARYRVLHEPNKNKYKVQEWRPGFFNTLFFRNEPRFHLGSWRDVTQLIYGVIHIEECTQYFVTEHEARAWIEEQRPLDWVVLLPEVIYVRT